MEVITLEQKINSLKISFLLNQEKIHDKKDEETKQALKSIYKNLKNNKISIVYKTSKDFKKNNFGRIYGFHNSKYGCLGTLPRTIRGYLADDDYIDIDIKRCHWYLLKYLIQKNGELNESYINNFINNYDDLVKKIASEKIFKDDNYSMYHTDTDKAKESIFGLLYASPNYLGKNSKLILELDDTFKRLHNQIYNVLLPSLKEEYKELVEILTKKNDKNKDGTILSHILQHLERIVVLDIVKYFNDNGYKIGCIIHDGFLMYKSNNFTDDFLEQCEKYIKEKYKNLEIKLVIKPFVKGDLPIMPYDYKEEEDYTTHYSILCETLLKYTIENNLRKDEDGNIYKRSSKNKLHYELSYQRDGYKQLLEEVFDGDKLFNSNPSNYDNMVRFIKGRNMAGFKNVKTDKDLLGFSNCILNLRTLEITNLEDIKDNDDRIVRHYIDKPLDTQHLNTTKFEDVVMYQLQNEEAMKWYYIFFGRLFFSPDNDSLQVIPIIKGVCNTGKSMQGNIISECFKKNTIGTVQSNQEQVFGMESFLDKEVIIAMDLPENMKNIISVDLFKAMSSGETVNIPQKNKKALTIKWHIPTIWITNYYPNYEDKGGATSKRNAFFEFDRPVENPDSSVETYIINTELPSIIYKACKMYKEFLDKKINKTFNDIRPEYFIKTNEEYGRATNILYQFLTKPDSVDDDGNIYRIEYNNSYETPFNEVQHEFKKWCKYNNIKNNKIQADDSTFSQMNLQKVVLHICKSCNNRHTRNCCENYSRINRTTKTLIKGIRFNILNN